MAPKRLRPYQIGGLSYALTHDHPAIFWQMRLGKTLLAIKRVKLYDPQPKRVLVVAPNSALTSWLDELPAEGETGIVTLWGTRRARLDALHGPGKWWLINKEGFIALPELAQVAWDVIILDESTFIKNPKAKVTKFFLQNFRQCPHRWALTGTPNPESDLEFYCQLAWLDGNFMGCKDYWEFRVRYFDKVFYDWQAKIGASKAIRQAVGERASVLRRKDVGIDVTKIYQTRKLQLDADTLKAYQKLEKDFATEIAGQELKTMFAGAQFAWLRQMASGLVNGQLVWPGKVNELADLLTGELQGEQVVVWFAFNAEITASLVALTKAGVAAQAVIGDTAPAERVAIFRKFQSGKLRVLLLQQAVGMTGLDLSAADTAIYFSLPTSLMTLRQTEDRILKVGKAGLLYLTLVTEGTVDDDVNSAVRVKGFTNDLSIAQVIKSATFSRVRGSL